MQNRTLSTEDIIALATQAAVAAVEAALAEPAKAPAKKPARKPAAKAPARTAKAPKCLVRKNRAEFVKAHPWAQGLSTYDIAIAHIHLGQTLKGGWALGEGYDAKARLATKQAIADVRKHLA